VTERDGYCSQTLQQTGDVRRAGAGTVTAGYSRALDSGKPMTPKDRATLAEGLDRWDRELAQLPGRLSLSPTCRARLLTRLR
jgi:hypothetical protein